MRGATLGGLAGICVLCLAAAGCTGAGTSRLGDQQSPAAGAQGPATTSAQGPATTSAQGPATASAQSPATGSAQGPATAGAQGPAKSPAPENAAAPPASSGAGMPMSAGTLGVAGTAARSSSGSAGAAQLGGSGAQAGVTNAGTASPQAGTGGVGAQTASGAAGAAGSGACPSPNPLYVKNGVPIKGAGCNQQWEGIVMTNGGRGLCTASFISDRHLISASHCYASDGPVSLQVSAPTWENGARHSFQAQVKRSGSEMELDISIIDLGKAVDWATPERRFVLHAGAATPSDLHLYGFGNSSTTGGAGTLRGVSKRATIHVADMGNGTLTGMSAEAQLCEGDSGGPALAENTAAVLYGINQGADPPGNIGFGTCAEADWTIVLTNVSKYVSFVEQAMGKPCARKQVDGLDVAQCW